MSSTKTVASKPAKEVGKYTTDELVPGKMRGYLPWLASLSTRRTHRRLYNNSSPLTKEQYEEGELLESYRIALEVRTQPLLTVRIVSAAAPQRVEGNTQIDQLAGRPTSLTNDTKMRGYCIAFEPILAATV